MKVTKVRSENLSFIFPKIIIKFYTYGLLTIYHLIKHKTCKKP